MGKKFNVVGIGNAMVDILGHVTDETLQELGIGKGIMQLIDLERSKLLLRRLGDIKQTSGGSAANTIAGLSQLNISTAYIGKVKEDELGEVFAKDLKSIGAFYDTKMADPKVVDETGRCIVMITPDGERSMNTYLGVTENLSPNDIDDDIISRAEFIYLEGYRFDGPESKKAFEKATQICKANDGKVALTLSDPFCVARHSQSFEQLIDSKVDILFCNEEELKMLHGSGSLSQALIDIGKKVQILACTVAERGAYVCVRGDTKLVSTKSRNLVDSTGAGDLFAAGFLYGLCSKRDELMSAKMGNIAAGEIITHVGPRLETNLLEVFKQTGLD